MLPPRSFAVIAEPRAHWMSSLPRVESHRAARPAIPASDRPVHLALSAAPSQLSRADRVYDLIVVLAWARTIPGGARAGSADLPPPHDARVQPTTSCVALAVRILLQVSRRRCRIAVIVATLRPRPEIPRAKIALPARTWVAPQPIAVLKIGAHAHARAASGRFGPRLSRYGILRRVLAFRGNTHGPSTTLFPAIFAFSQ